MTSPFAKTKPWQDKVLELAVKWFKTGAPTRAEWDEWTKATYEAYEDREASGWDGEDGIFDDGHACGEEDRREEVEHWQMVAHDGP
jgi:hypothetical protein